MGRLLVRHAHTRARACAKRGGETTNVKGMIYIDSPVLSARCLSSLPILSDLIGIQHLFCAATISTYLSQAKKFKALGVSVIIRSWLQRTASEESDIIHCRNPSSFTVKDKNCVCRFLLIFAYDGTRHCQGFCHHQRHFGIRDKLYFIKKTPLLIKRPTACASTDAFISNRPSLITLREPFFAIDPHWAEPEPHAGTATTSSLSYDIYYNLIHSLG